MVSDVDLRRDFPRLNDSNYKRTSPESTQYNCFAWASGVDDRRWEPITRRYWPNGVTTRDVSFDALIQHFDSQGYEQCRDGSLEKGFEKVALYAIVRPNELIPTHAAKQLQNGWWTSKLGDWDDIIHSSPDDLISNGYGEPVMFMRRAMTKEAPRSL